jgi:hypothetical protein
MKSSEVEGRMRERLAAAGVDFDAPRPEDVPATWDIVLELARERVTDANLAEYDDADMLLAQYGTYDWGEGAYFEVDLARQFVYTLEDGEQGWMAQLRCVFRYEPSPYLRELGDGSLWSIDLELDDFASKFRAMPGFQVTDRPVRLEISLDDV